MKMTPGLSVVIFILMLSGCSPARKVVSERTLSPGEVMNRVRERNAGINTLTGKGTITIESTDASNSGSFTVSIRKPDSLRIDLRGTFGIRIVTLMLSRERFLYFNWMENIAIDGRPDEKTLASLIQISMPFDRILNAFTGEVNEIEENDSLDRFAVENSLYLAVYRSEKCKKEYRIDGDTFVVQDYSFTDESGETTLTAHAEEANGDDIIPVPRFIRIALPGQGRSVTIAYDNVYANVPVSCSFSFPKQAEVIYK